MLQTIACEMCNDEGFLAPLHSDFDPSIHSPIRCGCGAEAPAVVRFLWVIDETLARLDDEAAHGRAGDLVDLYDDCAWCGAAAHVDSSRLINGAVMCRECWAGLVAAVNPRRVEAHPETPARCICESHWACLAVLRADEFNERRALPTIDDLGRTTPGQDEWEVSPQLRKIAAEVEASCPAAIHYPSVTADVWFGRDVEVVEWDDPTNEKALQTRVMCEDALADYCSRDQAEIRHAEEYDRYVSQQAWITQLTELRREQLAAAIRAMSGGRIPSEAVAWVQARIEKKHGNLLRAYSSCLFELRRAIESGRASFDLAQAVASRDAQPLAA